MILPDTQVEVQSFSGIEELSGKLRKEEVGNKLMNSVIENDQEKVDEGKTIREALNQAIGSFTPDLMMDSFVTDYNMAKNLYGPKLISLLSGYDDQYIERNIQIPEFQRELKQKLEENVKKLKKDKLIDKEGFILESGIELASLTLYFEELDNIIPKGSMGQRLHKKISHYGEKQDVKKYKKGHRFKDIALRKSLKNAIRRNHKEILIEDLQTFNRESRGETYIIYGLDASGSMRGKKIDAAKRAGVALSFKAIENKDMVGLITFGSEVKEVISPTNDFGLILKELTRVKASKETDIVGTINKAIDLFPNKDVTKHIVLLSDALPTFGKDPEEETLKAISSAKANNISVSLIGIDLDEKGEELGRKIVEIGNGRFYICNKLDNLDKLILEDYFEIQ